MLCSLSIKLNTSEASVFYSLGLMISISQVFGKSLSIGSHSFHISLCIWLSCAYEKLIIEILENSRAVLFLIRDFFPENIFVYFYRAPGGTDNLRLP